MRPKILAFYLPQYYPFPENDEWWGKGFTEWTSVGRAKPLFKGHYQPKVPADLGYYDLRLPIIREQQSSLAKEYGIDGFCYWHYWFGNGKRLLDLVETEVVESGRPDFPFCYFWANHSWKASNWNAIDSKISQRFLIKQEYPGIDDYEKHFQTCLKAFQDSRYIKEYNKPVFGIFDPLAIPDVNVFMDCWNSLAINNGFNGIYFVCFCMKASIYEAVKQYHFDEFVVDTMNLSRRSSRWRGRLDQVKAMLGMNKLISLKVIPYSNYAEAALAYYKNNPQVSPCVLPNYDHSPRSGRRGLILHGATPVKFKLMLIEIRKILDKKELGKKHLFIKSWNEWGEGNYLEPDLKYGRGFLESIKDVFGEK